MTQGIKLIVGLGNPGPEYELTRHNAGALFVERLADRHNVSLRPEPKYFGLTARLSLGGQDVRLLIPTTFMNRSGESVQGLVRFYKLEARSVLVVHDELDLPTGVARLKRGGGHGGHNGLRSVVAQIGREFFRLRLGVGHPGNRDMVIDYVLSRPSAAEEGELREAISEAVGVMPILLGHGDERAMTRLHTRNGQAESAEKAGAGSGPQQGE